MCVSLVCGAMNVGGSGLRVMGFEKGFELFVEWAEDFV